MAPLKPELSLKFTNLLREWLSDGEKVLKYAFQPEARARRFVFFERQVCPPLLAALTTRQFLLLLKNNEEPIELILEAINAAGYRPDDEIALALDPAASEFYEGGKYVFAKSDGTSRSSEEMVRFFGDWLRQYPIISLEDGWAEDDWGGWKLATEELGSRVQLVGDDIFVTNPKIISRGVREGVANSVLIKLNQIGTVTETLKAIKTAREAGYTCVCSHRSGETEDAFLADFTVASGTGQIKTGSLSRSDRMAKYNRLLRIERELRTAARFPGRRVFAAEPRRR